MMYNSGTSHLWLKWIASERLKVWHVYGILQLISNNFALVISPKKKKKNCFGKSDIWTVSGGRGVFMYEYIVMSH